MAKQATHQPPVTIESQNAIFSCPSFKLTKPLKWITSNLSRPSATLLGTPVSTMQSTDADNRYLATSRLE